VLLQFSSRLKEALSPDRRRDELGILVGVVISVQTAAATAYN
jgi:hypothetical protein